MGDHGYYDLTPEQERSQAEHAASELEQVYSRDSYKYVDICLDCGCHVARRKTHDQVCVPKLERRTQASGEGA